MKIWQIHLFGRLFKALFLILAFLFLAYMLIDLSSHGVRFLAKNARLLDLFIYYLHSFSRHFDLFLSLAFLLALLRVLSDLAQHSELTALQMAGLSNLRLSSPLFAAALLLLILSFANAQWISPCALGSIEHFRAQHAAQKKAPPREHVHTATLEDGSQIVYQSYDPQTQTASDLFWLQEKERFWHIKKLDIGSPVFLGHCVELFERNDEGRLVLINSYPEFFFGSLPLAHSNALQAFIPFESRPLSALFVQSFQSGPDKSSIRAAFHHKLALALLPFLIVLSLSPKLLSFSRTKPVFLIAAVSLFLLIAFLTLLDGMLILAENRVLPPAFAIWILWIAFLIPSLRGWMDNKS